jgi:hypothetical protein
MILIPKIALSLAASQDMYSGPMELLSRYVSYHLRHTAYLDRYASPQGAASADHSEAHRP